MQLGTNSFHFFALKSIWNQFFPTQHQQDLTAEPLQPLKKLPLHTKGTEDNLDLRMSQFSPHGADTVVFFLSGIFSSLCVLHLYPHGVDNSDFSVASVKKDPRQ